MKKATPNGWTRVASCEGVSGWSNISEGVSIYLSMNGLACGSRTGGSTSSPCGMLVYIFALRGAGVRVAHAWCAPRA